MTARPSVHPASLVLQSPPIVRAGSLDALSRDEWVLANGLGGFAMGSASGIPTRRYHGWLVGAARPPVARVMALVACSETLVLLPGAAGGNEQRIDLSTFRFSSSTGGVHSPGGHVHLQRFERDPAGAVRWEYAFGPVRVSRELLAVADENATLIRWRVRTGGHAARLEVRPLVALRDFHGPLLDHAQSADRFACTSTSDGIEIGVDAWHLSLTGDSRLAGVRPEPGWWYNFEYKREAERGLECHEDLFCPCVFEYEVPSFPGSGAQAEQTAELTAHFWSGAPIGQLDANSGFDQTLEIRRARLGAISRETLAPVSNCAPADRAVIASFVAAGDQFLVRRDARFDPDHPGVASLGGARPSPMQSVIAGYPWFGDWGRDTMIALPGLFLATRRFAEARAVLESFARVMDYGLIPNCFDETSGAPRYNTVDASLWFIHAACEYVRASGDLAGFTGPVHAACLSIVEAYRRGTEFGIGMDADGLIFADHPGEALTWMDAKRDGVVFTPRAGKAVEVNALWYSGLLELAATVEPREPKMARELRQVAQRAGDSFRAKFWDAPRSCLFDVVSRTPDGVEVGDASLRPNQIFAVSLPHSPLDLAQQKSVVDVVRSRLLTPMGLRTLDPRDPRYAPRYRGTLMDRDRAYHNGTAWPWLVGAYAKALLRIGAQSPGAAGLASAAAEARDALAPLLRTIHKGASLGSIAEVFDAEPSGSGDDVQRPDGCMAQAWSVACTLEALIEVIRAGG